MQASLDLLSGRMAPNHAIPTTYQPLLGKEVTPNSAQRALDPQRQISNPIVLAVEDAGSRT